MYLDYSKLEFDSYNRPEMPELKLQTMSGEDIGIIPFVSDLKLNIKFSEPSEISFDVAKFNNGWLNPLYDSIEGFKLIYTKHYGIYVIMNPEMSADGILEVKKVKGFSLEKTLESKKLFIEEGTFNFWNPASPDDTIIGRILEIASGWSPGYISPNLMGLYRTFDSYDDYLLSFMYDTAPKKFRCVFVFDTYLKTINVYDSDEERPALPIYLDFDNLVNELDINELSDELVTAMRPYGADELGIQNVNPIGTNWIYDLSYFIANGDIPDTLAKKWDFWQRSILNKQGYYKGLMGLLASARIRHFTAEQDALPIQGEVDSLIQQQSQTIQTQALEITDTGRAKQQERLDNINANLKTKRAELKKKQDEIKSIQKEIDEYNERIKEITSSLSIRNYFTDDEYAILANYLIEQDMTEETFVATDVDSTISSKTYNINSGTVKIRDSQIVEVDFSDDLKKTMYTLSGGTFSISGNVTLSGDVIRGTLEKSSDNKFILSIYAGSLKSQDTSAPSGTVAISGLLSRSADDIHSVTTDDITDRIGSKLDLICSSSTLYFTENVSEYQKYSVETELFEFAVKTLSDVATPTYEFAVESGNFIFAKEFEPFRKNLELGKGIYLKIGENEVITPIIIEFELDFEDRRNFSILFSNRFKRHDNVNTLKDMIDSTYSATRNFDASKHIYNKTVDQATTLSEFMKNSIDAAVNTIKAASNMSVIINGAGINVGSNSKYQLRIIDSMIAMTDDNWDTAKLAIGRFASPEIGEYWGVNAEVIGGKLIVGYTLIIENKSDAGVMQFRVDASGAWMNNATIILQSDRGGKILLSPEYGIAAGNRNLFTLSGTTVIPSFINSSGDIVADDDGMPEDTNFFFDLRDGNAYFRGRINATSGSIGGWTIKDDYLYSGSGSTFVALNASGGWNAAYAIWAGASNPANAPFKVMRNGNLYAEDGTFGGTIYGNKLKIGDNLMMSNGKILAKYLELKGIRITDNSGKTTFEVTDAGNITISGNVTGNISGNITMGPGSSINWANVSEKNASQSEAYQRANDALDRADDAYDYAGEVDGDVNQFKNNLWTEYITSQKMFNMLTNDRQYFGLFSDDNGKLYINAHYIHSDFTSTDLVCIGNQYGKIYSGTGYNGAEVTHGMIMQGGNSDSNPYFIATESGCRMSISDSSTDPSIWVSANYAYIGCGEQNIGVTRDSVKISAGSQYITVTTEGISASEECNCQSDRRVKHSIEYDMGRYESFFMDLKPTQFRYNHGTSNRYHTGFIAQDVEYALAANNISASDFAGLVIEKLEPEEGSETDTLYGLRYGEFISLNTYMIQHLYKRIEAMEAQLKSIMNKKES